MSCNGSSFVRSPVLLVLPLTLLLASCTTFPRPDDQVLVAVPNLPTDSQDLFFVAQLEGGLKQLEWYECTCLGWSSSPSKSGCRIVGEPNGIAVLKREEAIRYGVVLRNDRRRWRVWWFEPDDVLGIPPDPDTGTARWKLDLSKGKGPDPVSDETLHWLGIILGYERPRWRALAEGESPTLMEGRMPGWLLESTRSQLLEILSDADKFAQAGSLAESLRKCVVMFDALERELHWYPKWTHSEGAGLEQVFQAFPEIDLAVSKGDPAAISEGIQRMRDGLSALKGSDEPRSGR